MFDHPVARNILGLLIALCGIASLAVLLLMLITGINYSGAPFIAAALSVLLSLICSAVNLFCGFLSMGRNGRSRSFTLMILVQIFVFASMFQIILAGICGIYVIFLYILIGTGIIVPEFSVLLMCAIMKKRPRLR